MSEPSEAHTAGLGRRLDQAGRRFWALRNIAGYRGPQDGDPCMHGFQGSFFGGDRCKYPGCGQPRDAHPVLAVT